MSEAEPGWVQVLFVDLVLALIGFCALFLLYRRAHTLRSTQLFRSVCPFEQDEGDSRAEILAP